MAPVPLTWSAAAVERWPDGSVRWARLDAEVRVPPEGMVLDVVKGEGSQGGPLRFTSDGLRASVVGGCVELLVDVTSATPLMVRPERGQAFPLAAVSLAALDGSTPVVAFESVEPEHVGSLRVQLRVLGRAEWSDGRRIDVRLRVTVLGGIPAVGLELGLLNPNAAAHPGGVWELGDAGSVLIGAAGIVQRAPTTMRRARVAIDSCAEPLPVDAPYRLVQHASGGKNWRSPVHVDRDGVVPMTEQGYVESVAGLCRSGLRASPRLVIEHDAGRMTVATPYFWEVFPKGFELSTDGTLTLWSLPPVGLPHELQGGERCDFTVWIGFDAGPDSLAEGALAWVRQPATCLPEASDIAIAELLGGLAAGTAGENEQFERLVGAGIDGTSSFMSKRELIDEFGWRHFGELYADHENGPDPYRRIVSHYNNQYDAVLGFTLQAVRTNDHRWWRLACELAWHVTRTDIYWTDGDRAAYNGGLFWHTAHYMDAGRSTHRTYPSGVGLPGGGPANEHCYSRGLLLHYLITGDAHSRDAVIRLADWILAADDGRLAPWPLPWLSHTPTGAASSTYSPDYHGPGRGAANSILTLLDGYRLTAEPRYLEQAVAIFERVIHPDDDIDEWRLSDVEARWSYTVMLQAVNSANQSFELLGLSRCSLYARACLLKYARWMLANEYFYLDRPERLEFANETWAAQELRKADVLYCAALQASSLDERRDFLAAAEYFYGRSIAWLAETALAARCRPLVLLLQNGYVRSRYLREIPGAAVLPEPAREWPARSRFRPQRQRAKQRIVVVALVLGAMSAVVAAALLLR